MKIGVPLVAVIILFLLAYVGVGVMGLHAVFGIVVPYIAIAVFLIGVVARVLGWARVPVPFRIPTTCGQEKSLPWIRQNKLDCPYTTWQVIGRMALEILFFRSLFRNTRTELHKTEGGPRVAYASAKWLWLFGLLFHYSFLVIFVRHLRFFTEPVPGFITFLENVDGFFQVGVPVFYATTVIFLAAVGYLFLRRVVSTQMRYISLANDFFPLFLLLGIGITGFFLRHLTKTDIVGVKELGLGLLSFSPSAPESVDPLFYGHLFLVSVLFLYFPFSKLTHMFGVFMSPTRNLANNNRAVRHVNPWNAPVKVHTYAEYVEEFGDKMRQVDIPIEPIPGKE